MDNRWFVDQHINNSMFFILNWSDTTDSGKDKFLPKIFRDTYQHTSYEITDILFRLGFHGRRLGVFIRTNEVTIEIDGKKIKSYYSEWQ